MTRTFARIAVFGSLITVSSAFAGLTPEFAEDTLTRLPDADVRTDNQEKDMAWGDVDQDGDIDLVIVRKEPFSSGHDGRANYLLMNEGIAEGHSVNGVLVDRTGQYATAADDGGQGFFDETNDRDVVLADLNGDGWLDIVTATTLSENTPKTISHPRVYINLGESRGQWQGFRYEEARIPQLEGINNFGFPFAPRFCSVAAGDVTGDGAPDLYFGDYDNGTGATIQQLDFNNRLLINDGNGFFTDESDARLTFEMRNSAFGAASIITDVNDDGVNDIVKQTSLNPPEHVAITYNNENNEGNFDRYDIITDAEPYFVSAGDLNNDGRLDLVVTDDFNDTFMLNQGNDAFGDAEFLIQNFPEPDDNFGGNSVIFDMNNDGWLDVIITDVDVDQSGCFRTTEVYLNNANPPNVSFSLVDIGISTTQLRGVHDIALIDLNNDGFLDMIWGRCDGTQVWINQPPVNLAFEFPNGVPSLVSPNQTATVEVDLTATGSDLVPGSARVFTSISGAPFTDAPLQSQGGGSYLAPVPAASCGDNIRWYVQGELQVGGTFTAPAGAPQAFFTAFVGEDIEVAVSDDLEGDTSGWSVVSDPSLSTGSWEAAVPNGTITGGSLAAPGSDNTPNGSVAFVTGNGVPGGAAGADDIDGGSTTLITPAFNLAGTDGTVSFARWFFCSDAGVAGEDFMTVDISNNGGDTWVNIPELTTGGTNGQWETVSFNVSEYVTPSNNLVVRFVASDFGDGQPAASITEAGIDDFSVEEIVCGGLPGDLNGSGNVNGADLLILLNAWGSSGPADLDGSGTVSGGDLLILLNNWG